ncbi:MAG TPA: response regulator [Bryobacteraceae bacterium]|nr:response regulator [Bryobacteraceae bacterium]
MPTRLQRPFQILIVEDNPGDVGLTIEALRDARIPNEVHVVMDGEEALDFLRAEGKYLKAPKPDLVFLDLCIPKIDGHQVLSAMKSDPRLRRIPVVVVSSSGNDRDIQAAYDEQASTYVVKPADLDEYFTAIRALKELWFHIAALPRAAKLN